VQPVRFDYAAVLNDRPRSPQLESQLQQPLLPLSVASPRALFAADQCCVQLLKGSVGRHWQLRIDCWSARVQVMEGSEGGNQEDDLELLEGASIKPDWQVSPWNDQSGKDTLLVDCLDFSWVPSAVTRLSSCDIT